MKKNIILFKKTFLITGSLSILLALIDYFFNVMYFDAKGYFGAFQFLIFLMFVLSLYLFFIFSDIEKDKFICLKRLNYFGFIVLILISGYWFFNYNNPRDAIVYFVIYFYIFVFVNLILMTIIYEIKKTGGHYFLKEWLYFFGLIAFCILYVIIIKCIKS